MDSAVVSYTGAYGGEVGRMVGFSRRVRYSAQGSAPFGKIQSDFKSIFLFTELFLKITVLEMLPEKGVNADEKEGFRDKAR